MKKKPDDFNLIQWWISAGILLVVVLVLLVWFANAVRGAAFVITEPLLVATAIYFCLCFPTSKLIAYFERRMSHGDKR